jgi:hypothetical protein
MMPMKTHFDPYADPDDGPPEIADCGTRLGEECDLTWKWKDVTCKRCLKAKARLTRQHEETEKIIVQQMGGMADFLMRKEA